MHLNIGLDRLRQTEDDVESLRKGLAVKEAELAHKNKEASDKLQVIVADQAEAEQQKAVRTMQSWLVPFAGVFSSDFCSMIFGGGWLFLII